jgi:signal transduction histidine kinase
MSAHVLKRSPGQQGHGEVVERQLRNVGRMQRMIRDLLDYARSRHGGALPIVRARKDLARIAMQAVEVVQTLRPDRSFRLTAKPDCIGELDEDRVLQLLDNLLGNAVAYSASGTPIEVGVRCDEDWLECRIHNQGPPIPAEVVPTIFEPFRRARSGNNPEGFGLGLFIVREIAAAHGGSVEVLSSAESGGTTFVVRLPKRAPP